MTPDVLIARLGGPTKAAKRLGLKRTTISMWRVRDQVPHGHCRAISAITGIPLWELRPDVWGAPDAPSLPETHKEAA